MTPRDLLALSISIDVVIRGMITLWCYVSLKFRRITLVFTALGIVNACAPSTNNAGIDNHDFIGFYTVGGGKFL